LIWLLRDLDLLSVLARAASLAFEALLLGGIAYLLVAARPAKASEAIESFCRRGIRVAALALVCGELAMVCASCAILVISSGLSLKDLATTNFVLADSCAILFALAIYICAKRKSNRTIPAMLPLALLLLAATVCTSHAAARIDHRALLAVLTGVHHLGTAAWIGAMPFLLISLGRVETADEARSLTQRYSRMALRSAAMLVLAGVGMAWFYVGSWSGLYGTSYGIMLLAKVYLLLLMAGLGAGNWLLVRRLTSDPQPLLARLRRVTETEIGLGFTAVLVAASLTGQPPAVDVAANERLMPQDIYVRMHPEPPRMTSPGLAALTPPIPVKAALQDSEFNAKFSSDANDMAWSEYNHHWAGLIVLVAGLLALLSRHNSMRWTRFWPLSFAGLAVFILLRADPENWPLGPRSFWKSFSAPDVLQHRFGALLILVFAAFECAVQAGNLRARWATLVFPATCALGAAMLLTHEHAARDLKQELLIGMSHTPIALVGITAGWSRWLELRLPKSRFATIAGYLWPLCLALAGLILLNYREI
jgi:copper resistance protein D